MESSSAQASFQDSSAERPVVKEAFDEVCQHLRWVKDSQSPSMKLFVEWFDEVMLYNVPHGKLWRLLQVIQTLETMSSSPVSSKDLKKAAILGWVVEMLQAHFLILDDIMDKSITRRGRKCWYLMEEVGLTAINDALLLEAAALRVVREVFRAHPSYLDILELLQETHYQTCQGQCLDMLSERKAVYDEERYNRIVELKTSYYTFSLPIRLGMYLANECDPDKHKAAERIALQIGNIFQVQDDYLDCYGDPSKIGKIGTDIIDSKCSWLLVQALKIATPEQKNKIIANIGKGASGGCEENVVKATYRELEMDKVFREYETQSFDKIKTTIEQTERQCGLQSTMFHQLVKKLYRREK